MKNVWRRIKEWISLFFIFTWWIWLLIACGFIAYLISTSDLPDWFKFWLLK